MYIVLLILWFLTGFFVARSIKQRKQLRELHYAEFFNYHPIRKEDNERTTQKISDEMGNVLREHNSSLFDF